MDRHVRGKARIVPIASRCKNGYQWQWQAVDGAVSSRNFELFYDCLSSARNSGYAVDLGPPPPAIDAGSLDAFRNRS